MKNIDAQPPTAFITGISSGIGAALAEALIKEGWYVFGTVRQLNQAVEIEADCKGHLKVFVMDVRADEATLTRCRDWMLDLLKGRPLNAIIHNAGVALGGPVLFQPDEELILMVETNTIAPVRITRVLFPLLGEGSRIVFVSSVSGRIVSPFVGGYAISKHGLEAYVDALRNESRQLGIKVISIQPGPVKTPIWKKALKAARDYSHTPYRNVLDRQQKVIERIEAEAMPIEIVVGVLHKVLKIPRPKARYLIVPNSRLIKIISILPDKWKDYLIFRRLRKSLDSE